MYGWTKPKVSQTEGGTWVIHWQWDLDFIMLYEKDLEDLLEQIKTARIQASCKHEEKEYQAYEPDTNVPESYSCVDCGAELDIPEPDWDALNKE
jgi:hypothetical protein